jgi:hypothetical protein
MKTFTNRVSVIVMTAFMLLAWQGMSEGNGGADFIGTKKCKMCHKKPEAGEQFKIWSESKHAQAFEVLGTDEAKKVAAERGIEDHQKSGKCLKCHSTAYFFTEEQVTNIDVSKKGEPRLTVEDAIGCESCHGAGSDYQKKKVMKDFDASVAAGMNPEPGKSCIKCHNEESPSWDAAKYTLKDGTKVGFDYDQAYETIKHPKPEAAAE